MHPFVSFLLQQGLPRETISVVVFAPFIIVLIVAARHVVGLRTHSVYTPFILTFALVQMGLWPGLAVLSIVVAVGAVVRMLLGFLQLLHLPRVGLVMTAVLASMLALFVAHDILGQRGLVVFTPITFFALLVLVEDSFTARLERKPMAILRYLGETLSISVAGFMLVSSQPLQALFFSMPWLPFLASFALLLFLGRWTGLRVGEYIRFRKIL